jgi:hypothetical protein
MHQDLGPVLGFAIVRTGENAFSCMIVWQMQIMLQEVLR